jgi:hypothetical protein
MGLSTEKKVFIVEYGSGCEGGSSLKNVAEQFREIY